jgi:hypothetical protein
MAKGPEVGAQATVALGDNNVGGKFSDFWKWVGYTGGDSENRPMRGPDAGSGKRTLFCACPAFVFGDGGGKGLRRLVGGYLEKRPPDPEENRIVFGQECP